MANRALYNSYICMYVCVYIYIYIEGQRSPNNVVLALKDDQLDGFGCRDPKL